MTTPDPQESASPLGPPMVEPYAPDGGPSSSAGEPYAPPQGGTANPYAEPNAQYRAAGQGYCAPAPAKSYTAALLLHLFLSGVGAGDFYMGFKKTAFGKLVLNIVGIALIVASIVMVAMIVTDPGFGPYNARLPTPDQVRALEGSYRLFHVGCAALGALVVWALISVIMVGARAGMYRADANGVPLA